MSSLCSLSISFVVLGYHEDRMAVVLQFAEIYAALQLYILLKKK